jgi:hypothetical protein
MEHDLLLRRKDGSVRCFRVYDRPIPKDGGVITLPVDGRLILRSRSSRHSGGARSGTPPDASGAFV